MYNTGQTSSVRTLKLGEDSALQPNPMYNNQQITNHYYDNLNNKQTQVYMTKKSTTITIYRLQCIANFTLTNLTPLQT